MSGRVRAPLHSVVKFVLSAVATVILVVGLSGGRVLAYNNDTNPAFGAKFPNGAIGWKWGPSINQTGYWAAGFTRASGIWTAANASAWPAFDSSAQAVADVYFAADGNGGITYWGYNCCWSLAQFQSYGNLNYNGDSAGFWTRIKQISAHELGHGIGMGHSTVAGAPVMRFDAPTDTLTTDDIDGIKAIYP